jgi:uncharacterized protein YcbK (DUF882 family)
LGDISQDFNRSEFACKCGCGRDNISLDLVDRLQRLRAITGIPIHINSGCRCIKHNQDQGGKPDSAHICEGKGGEAADIKIEGSIHLFRLISIIFVFNLFNRIGVGKSLLHVDVSKTLPQRVIWNYPDK